MFKAKELTAFIAKGACRQGPKTAGFRRFAALLPESFPFPLYGSWLHSDRRESVVAEPLQNVPPNRTVCA